MKKNRADGMTCVMAGWRYHGQPIYRAWLQNKTRLRFFSREIESLADGSWKLKRYIDLLEVKIDRRRKLAHIMEQKRLAEETVLSMEGVTRRYEQVA